MHHSENTEMEKEYDIIFHGPFATVPRFLPCVTRSLPRRTQGILGIVLAALAFIIM